MSVQPTVHDPANCPCKKRDCPRNRSCAQCMENHHKNGGLTTCERLAKQKG